MKHIKLSSKNFYDYIIIGTGIAGLSAARYVPKDKRVLFVCKSSPWECNTFLAQGGIALSIDKEDIELHTKDTITAGVGCNNLEAVKQLTQHSKEVVDDLIESGLQFDLNSFGELAYTKEGAHSRSRILHADGDATGRMMHMFLLKECPHEVVVDSIVSDILVEDGVCYGVRIRTGAKQRVVFAHHTIIASGGVGSIYKYHTNSTTIAGELQGICVEKGIALKDMEMMQFHPTVFVKTKNARKTLLSEALRGEGAEIEDEDGVRFLFNYHKDGEMAPRDVVSRAIFDHKQKTKKEVYLSFKKFDKKWFKNRFPNIYMNLKDFGYDLPYERVPISPAFHYSMGGIDVDLNSKVKGYKNLYAVGEVACTGVHGANRLASNSLLEGLVYSKLAIEHSLKKDYKVDPTKYRYKKHYFILKKDGDKEIKNRLRQIMWDNVGIIRDEKSLKDALEQIESFLKKDVGRLLYLRLLTAKHMVKDALARKVSVGAHFIK